MSIASVQTGQVGRMSMKLINLQFTKQARFTKGKVFNTQYSDWL